jgi:hypothetical protein
MSEGFSAKYLDTETPNCYADPDYYDRDDPECRRCAFRATCSSLVDKRKKEKARETAAKAIEKARAARGGKAEVAEKKAGVIRQVGRDFVLEEPDDDDTFTSVTIYNATLNAAQGAVDTIANAVAHIPRKSYSNVFSNARRRRRNKE